MREAEDCRTANCSHVRQTAKHTPGPYTPAVCGCYAAIDANELAVLVYCPLHAEAPMLLEDSKKLLSLARALQQTANSYGADVNFDDEEFAEMETTIARAEGRQG